MKKKKMMLTTLSILFFAVSGNFTAKAETDKNVTVPLHPGTVAVVEKIEIAASPGTEQQVAGVEVNQIPQISKGEQVVSYASQFLGNPYVYGGTSLTKGADCSGFVMRVYEQFGVSLPRTSREQGRVGIDVGGLENALPGDIVSYKGHIGIYQGQNKLVHASNPKDGIKISPVTYKPILSIRRVI